MEIEDNRLYDVATVADITSTPATTIRRWTQSGEILAIKTGRAWKVRGDELKRLLSEGTRPPRDEQQTNEGEGKGATA